MLLVLGAERYREDYVMAVDCPGHADFIAEKPSVKRAARDWKAEDAALRAQFNDFSKRLDTFKERYAVTCQDHYSGFRKPGL